MEETVDLRDYFGIVKKRFWIIALITIISVVVSGVISFFMLSPVYEAKSTLIVNTEKNEETQMITGDQFSVTQKLAVTYGEIIKSRTVLDEVIQNLKLDDKYEGLVNNVTVSPVKDTQIISISVQDTNKEKARDIANEIPKVFKKEAERITKANDIQVIDKAILPQSPIGPNKKMNMAIAAVIGGMIGLFVVFFIEYLDNKLKTPQDIEKHLGLPILGVIPNEKLER
ncbi:MAG: Wzz/FepE/Etk N-terminal domain-containing protein [Romboutsia timonensis]|uniref:YveK family protein n=1 Tax=Romboutsia timonensis TaxID=1776391 RepID=UPI002A755397|nr:Wzz/FepE/Etk N-terminal domain-containing protein [Romboutsia timonensis]MDY3001329.1 Wzz/FepE/Etk N-terminal domain-containing protein [Romboutsia timonensis]